MLELRGNMHATLRLKLLGLMIQVAFFSNAVLAGTPSQMLVAAGDNQTATAGTAVPGPVCAIVTDSNNAPVAGVTVTWGSVTGGGSITGEMQITNTSGVVTLGSWTLGVTAGANSITASSAGLNSVTFNAVGVAGPASTAGPAARFAVAAGNNQIAPAGSVVQGAVCAIVTDADNLPIAEATVTWSVATGGGSVTDAT